MMLNEDRQFDDRIRAILEDGREEVPDRVWEAVSGRLPERRKKPAPIILLRRGAAIAAAAAAAVFALLLTWPESDAPVHDARGDLDRIAVLTGPAEEVDVDFGLKPAVPTAGPAHDPGKRLLAYSETPSGSGSARHDDPASSAIRQETEEEAAVSHETTEAQSPSGKLSGSAMADLPDDFPEDEAIERRGRRPAVSMTIFGNALGNTSNSMSDGRMAPMQSPGRMPKDGIIEDCSNSYGIPLSFGMGARIAFTERWSMSVGVNYSLLTRSFSGTYYDSEGTAFSDSDIRNRQSYIGIPVNVYYNILKGKFVDFYAYLGGTVEKCVADRYSIDAPDRMLTYRGESRGVQLSANAGIGVEFILADQLGLYVDPSIRYYFKSRQPKSIRTEQPLMLGFEAGFRVRF